MVLLKAKRAAVDRLRNTRDVGPVPRLTCLSTAVSTLQAQADYQSLEPPASTITLPSFVSLARASLPSTVFDLAVALWLCLPIMDGAVCPRQMRSGGRKRDSGGEADLMGNPAYYILLLALVRGLPMDLHISLFNSERGQCLNRRAQIRPSVRALNQSVFPLLAAKHLVFKA